MRKNEENQWDDEDGRHKTSRFITVGHPSKAEKRLSIYIFLNVLTLFNAQKFYNFLIINATSQKAHRIRKKA